MEFRVQSGDDDKTFFHTGFHFRSTTVYFFFTINLECCESSSDDGLLWQLLLTPRAHCLLYQTNKIPPPLLPLPPLPSMVSLLR
jgi:hypothetical protein